MSEFDLDAPYPCTVLCDRYSGTYSGGLWIAFNLEASEIPAEVDGDDTECRDYWTSLNGLHGSDALIGKGATPNEAVSNLAAKLKAKEND